MIVALDSNIVIYLIEANPTWTAIATARLTALRAGPATSREPGHGSSAML